MKRILTLTAFILVVLGVWWVFQKRTVNDTEVIKIGGAFGQTGICAEFGEGEFRGATLAVEEINAKTVENRGRTRLSAEFEEFQASPDIQKKTE